LGAAALLALLLLVQHWAPQWRPDAAPRADEPSLGQPGAAPDDDALRWAIDQQRSNIQVEAEGIVSRLLPDDRQGSRHQKFIVRLSGGETVLIAHNIDLAPRVADLKVGDTVRFAGEYEWNAQGGVVHWTHHDPRGRHADGWIEHAGLRVR
jgi:hypothetical protein